MKSCYFIGHREADERLLPLLGKAIEKLITEDRVAYFYVGAYGGFDRIVTTALKAAKKKHPNIVLMEHIIQMVLRKYRNAMRLFGQTERWLMHLFG